MWPKYFCQPTSKFSNNRGAAALEFAFLLPVWLLFFFAFLDYGWYLTNVLALENSVFTGARAGVKVKYWLTPYDMQYQDPRAIARQVVRKSFCLASLQNEDIVVLFRNADMEVVSEDDDYDYLEVTVPEYVYRPLTGYLPDSMIPGKIAAFSLMSFP